jgi:hypothetical protein
MSRESEGDAVTLSAEITDWERSRCCYRARYITNWVTGTVESFSQVTSENYRMRRTIPMSGKSEVGKPFQKTTFRSDLL